MCAFGFGVVVVALVGWSVCALELDVCAFGLDVVVVALGCCVEGWVTLGWVGALELELELGLVWGWEGNTACCGKDACR
jgi:hypothetical protein